MRQAWLAVMLGAPGIAFAQASPARGGITIEVQVGVGFLGTNCVCESNTDGYHNPPNQSDPMTAVGLGVGAWVSSRTAITLRAVGVAYSDNGLFSSLLFLGPAAQVWLGNRFWIGGGLGFAAVDIPDPDGWNKSGPLVGVDGRLGYSIKTGSKNTDTLSVSLEVDPGLTRRVYVASLALMVGYQH